MKWDDCQVSFLKDCSFSLCSAYERFEGMRGRPHVGILVVCGQFKFTGRPNKCTRTKTMRQQHMATDFFRLLMYNSQLICLPIVFLLMRKFIIMYSTWHYKLMKYIFVCSHIACLSMITLFHHVPLMRGVDVCERSATSGYSCGQ